MGTTVNDLNLEHFFNKICVIKAGIHKMPIIVGNREEDSIQTAASEAV